MYSPFNRNNDIRHTWSSVGKPLRETSCGIARLFRHGGSILFNVDTLTYLILQNIQSIFIRQIGLKDFRENNTIIIDPVLQQNYLAQVTSNIWGTKFKIVGLSTFLPTNLGAGIRSTTSQLTFNRN